jgi:hypothetical protein
MSSHLTRTDRALPTFFIIGAPKAGTTSFHYYLAQHPHIQMSNVKEPSFFAPDPYAEQRSINQLDRYERLFDPTIAVRGEASTSYAEYPFRQGVPEKIKALIPDPKFIYLVRDPIARTLSHYHHFVASEGYETSLEDTLRDLSDPRSPVICASLYALQLELYLRSFSQDRILVLDQAELLTDRRATLRRVFAFLEVDDALDSPRFDVEFLKTSERRHYAPGLARFVGLAIRPRVRWIPPGVRRSLRIAAERVLLPPLETSTLGSDMHSRLAEFFADDVERLRSLTGDMFPTWSV